MRRLSVVRVKSPTPSANFDPKLFTTQPDARTEASSPLTLTGASPRRSWFNFFSRAAPRALNKSDQPPLARSIVAALTSEELWSNSQPVLETLDVGLRFSKTLRCLKCIYPSGASSPTQVGACKFFLRMTSIVPGQQGSPPSTFLHFEFRSGSADEFLALFSLFAARMKDCVVGLEIDNIAEEIVQ